MPTRVNNSIANDAFRPSDGDTLVPPLDSLLTCVLDALPECISAHESSGQILWANRRLCDLYGKPLSELQGLNCREVFHGDGPECPHAQVLATGQAIQLAEDVHLSARDLSVTLQPLVDADGETRGFMRVMRDVTSERQATAQLRNAERFATLGQLLSGVAHDVGTPLNVISGYAEFLLMRTKPEGQGHKELSAILDQTRRIAAVFGQALDLARPPQGRADAMEIKALVADSLELVGHHLRRADVKASLTCRITPPLIYGEAPQLRQAFFNLLLNAAQRVGPGGRLQVVIDEAPDMPGFLGLTLLGVEANEVAHDFSRSFASFIVSQSEGETTGIGLYLARKILAEAGATIAPAAAAGEGLGLTVYLPVKPTARRSNFDT